MIKLAADFIPTKALVIGGILGSINKRVIFPVAASTATWVTTKTGILTHEQAKEQEQVFNQMLFPVNKIITDLENEVIQIISSGWDAVADYIDPEPSKKVQGENLPSTSAPVDPQREAPEDAKREAPTPREIQRNDPVLKYIQRGGVALKSGVVSNSKPVIP